MQPRFGKEGEELEFKIVSMQHLAEVADSISSIRIELDIHDICGTLTEMLIEKVEANSGNTTLQFTIVDHQDDVKIKLGSKRYRVAPTADFMNFLETNELNYFINI